MNHVQKSCLMVLRDRGSSTNTTTNTTNYLTIFIFGVEPSWTPKEQEVAFRRTAWALRCLMKTGQVRKGHRLHFERWRAMSTHQAWALVTK